MGIDCKELKVVLHYGPSYNLESYLQESGRTSTDMCKSIMLYFSLKIKYCSDEIKLYAQESKASKRKMCLAIFDVDLTELPTVEHPPMCCDISQKTVQMSRGLSQFCFQLQRSKRLLNPSKQHTV